MLKNWKQNKLEVLLVHTTFSISRTILKLVKTTLIPLKLSTTKSLRHSTPSLVSPLSETTSSPFRRVKVEVSPGSEQVSGMSCRRLWQVVLLLILSYFSTKRFSRMDSHRLFVFWSWDKKDWVHRTVYSKTKTIMWRDYSCRNRAGDDTRLFLLLHSQFGEPEEWGQRVPSSVSCPVLPSDLTPDMSPETFASPTRHGTLYYTDPKKDVPGSRRLGTGVGTRRKNEPLHEKRRTR